MTGLSGQAEIFDVDGTLLGYPVSLEATMLESDQSVAAYGTIDIANNGTTEYVGIYLDYVSANT